MRSRLELIIEVDHEEDVDPMEHFLYGFDPFATEEHKDLNDSAFLVSEAWEDVS